MSVVTCTNRPDSASNSPRATRSTRDANAVGGVQRSSRGSAKSGWAAVNPGGKPRVIAVRTRPGLSVSATTPVPASSTDDGSDDLTFTWDWDDGTAESQSSRVNPLLDDPLKSPSVQPRDVTLEQTHTFGDACLYDLRLALADDDGGTASDAAAVVVTGTADLSKGSGWWLNQYRRKSPNDFTTAQLECYLQIAGFFSLVFPDGMTRAQGEQVLNAPAKSPMTVVFDQQALAAWLNVANGAIAFDTAVDTDGDGALDSTFGAAMLAAETVRTDPSATDQQVRAQKDVVERIVLRDGG